MGGYKMPDELVGFPLDFHAQEHTGKADEFYKQTYSTYQWLSARLQYTKKTYKSCKICTNVCIASS